MHSSRGMQTPTGFSVGLAGEACSSSWSSAPLVSWRVKRRRVFASSSNHCRRHFSQIAGSWKLGEDGCSARRRIFGFGGLEWRRGSGNRHEKLGKSSESCLDGRRCFRCLAIGGSTIAGKNQEDFLGKGPSFGERTPGQILGQDGDDEEFNFFDSDDEEEFDEDDGEIRGYFDEDDGDGETLEVEELDVSYERRSNAGPRESTATLVARLCADVQARDGFTVTVSDVTALYDFPLDKFQRLAIEGFLKGSSVVVCAPTSSGKTLIAEAAAAATLARKKRLFYTTPLKALSNQKLREFRKLFGEANVGLLTGDAAVNKEAPIMVMTTEILRNMLYQTPGDFGEGSRLENVTTIVLDEVHYLSDISRGTVWEETVIYCPRGVQLICLSATVANPEELAGWIAQVHGPTELVTGTKRPVPLKWQFSSRYELQPLLNDAGTAMNRRLSLADNHQRRYIQEWLGDGYEGQGDGDGEEAGDEQDGDGGRRRRSRGRRRGNDSENGSGRRRGNDSENGSGRRRGSDSENGSGRRKRGSGSWNEIEEPVSQETLQLLRRRQVPRVEDTLGQLVTRDMLPAIWFIFSRRGCDKAVRYLNTAELLSPEEASLVKAAISEFENLHPDAVRASAVGPLARGVAAHHAGCLPTWKAFVEELFQRGLVKVVFATETLAAGINMPARTTVLSTLSKRSDVGHALLSSNSMLQMAGRAGRRGIDEQGHVVVIQTPFEGAEDCCKLLFAGADPLVSQFTATYGMALNLLAGGRTAKSAHADSENLETVPFGRTLAQARELIEQSFGNYVGSEVIHIARKQLVKLEDEIQKLVAKVREEHNPEILASRLTKAEMEEYTNLKEMVKQKKAAMQKVNMELKSVTEMETLIPPADMSDDTEVADSEVPEMVNQENATVLKVVMEMESSAPSDKMPESGEEVNISELPAKQALAAQMQKEVSKLRKQLKRCQGYKENHQLAVLQKSRLGKITRLTEKASRISYRMKQMVPSGWKEFLQVVDVLGAVGALNLETSELLPLGQTAAAVRGENELWLALVFSNEAILSLTSPQLASVCGSLVSEGLKVRPESGVSTIYEASRPVLKWMVTMETPMEWLFDLQAEHGVQIPCHMDIQFAGMVEAWAAGVSWKELMTDSGMDEGDVARLLRRSIDLLTQIPHLPHMHQDVITKARQAAKVMDRPPISELLE